MTTTPVYDSPARGAGIGPLAKGFIGGIVLGLIIGAAIGFLAAGSLKMSPKWVDAGAGWVRLPGNIALGALPQTVSLPALTFDYGGVAQPLPQTVVDTGSIVKVDIQALAGRVGVSLGRPDGGELVSREAVINPQQGKTSVYFRTTPGMGPVMLLLRSADNVSSGASATVSKVQTATEADLGQSELNKVNKAGVY